MSVVLFYRTSALFSYCKVAAVIFNICTNAKQQRQDNAVRDTKMYKVLQARVLSSVHYIEQTQCMQAPK